MKNEAYYQAYLSHHHISRRGLLRHVFPATKSTIEKTQSRPPFSAREDLFSAVCNGCGECASACPNGLIQLKQQQATLEIDYAPVICVVNAQKFVRQMHYILIFQRIHYFVHNFPQPV